MRVVNHIVAFFLILTLASSCSDGATYKYEVPLTIDFTVPQSEIAQFRELTVFVDNVPTQYMQALIANATDESAVTSVQSGRADLSSSFGNVDLGFLDEISVRARSISDPSRIEEIFYFTDFRFQEGSRVQLIDSGREIKDIMSESTVNLEMVMTFQGNPAVGNVGMDLDFSYVVFDQ